MEDPYTFGWAYLRTTILATPALVAGLGQRVDGTPSLFREVGEPDARFPWAIGYVHGRAEDVLGPGFGKRLVWSRAPWCIKYVDDRRDDTTLGPWLAALRAALCTPAAVAVPGGVMLNCWRETVGSLPDEQVGDDRYYTVGSFFQLELRPT